MVLLAYNLAGKMLSNVEEGSLNQLFSFHVLRAQIDK